MFSHKHFLLVSLLLASLSSVSVAATTCLRAKDISGGERHTLVLMNNGTVWACGNNDYQQLGIKADWPNQYTLTQVVGENEVGFLTDITAVDAGWYHSLALDEDGSVWAWGYNKYGQCGNDEEEINEQTPVKVLDSDPETTDVYLGDEVTIIAVEAGENHSLALDSNGHVWAWDIASIYSRNYT